MKWLAVVLSGWALVGCAPECECESTVSVALTEEQDRLYISGGVSLSLCLDTSCIDFGGIAYDGSAVARNAEAIVLYNPLPPRLVFMSPEIRGVSQRSVGVFISSGRTQLVRQERYVDFTERVMQGVRCTPACTQASLP